MTVNKIIEEALHANMKDEMNGRHKSFLDRLFLREPSESEKKSRAILYLADRLLKEMKERDKAYRKEETAYRKAKKCVEIYGNEAVTSFEKMWNKI